MSTRDSGMIVEAINAYVHANAGGWAGSPRPLSRSPEIVARPWSFMLRYPVQNGNAILVKIARHKDMTIAESVGEDVLREDSERDFWMLSKIAEVFQSEGDGFCFVQPYEFFSQWNAFAMEELDVRLLKDFFLQKRMIWNAEKDWAGFRDLLWQGARWLQIFHRKAEHIEVMPLSQTDTLERLERSYARTGFDYASPRAVYEALSCREVPVAALHGDFHCGNIFVNKQGQVGAFDANMMRGPVYLDLAKLFADLETRFVQMILQGNFMRAAERKRVYGALLEGYTYKNELPFDKELFFFFVKVAILEKWAVDESAPKSKAKTFSHNATRGLRERYFSYLLKDEMRWSD